MKKTIQPNSPDAPTQQYRSRDGAGSPPPLPWNRRGAVVIACAAICLVTAFVYAGVAWPLAVYALLTDGVLAIVWLVAAYGLGSLAPLPESARPMRCVTRIAIGLGAMSLLTLGMGLAGAMNRVAAFAMIGAGVALAAWRLSRSRDALPTRLRTSWNAPAGIGWLWVLAMPLLGMAIVAAFVPPGVLWGDEPNGYDVVEYHLQVPREWYEAGRITGLQHNVFSYFPFNVEMQFLLAMHVRGGPWAGMYLAQLMHVGYVALSVAGVHAVARCAGGGSGSAPDRGSATIAGVLVAGIPWLALLAPVAYNEGGLLLYGTLAIGWTLHALREPVHRVASMAVAGAMAGLACGAKLTAVPVLLLPLPLLFLIITVVLRLPLRRAIVASLLFGIVGLAAFAPWVVRNVAWTGNPVFPEAQSVFGRAHFTTAQSERWAAAHAPRADQRGAGERLEAGWRQIAIDARYGFVLLPLALACAALAHRRPETWLLLAMLGVLAVVWLGFTHLQGRFFVLAIPVAALLVAQVSGRGPTIATAVVAAVVALIGIGVLHPRMTLWLHEKGVSAVLGIDALSAFMIPPVAQDVLADDTLALVGDARAFCYQRPMARLRYRTVFDVPPLLPGKDWLAAWLGDTADAPGAPTAILIDPGELGRFERTYRALPPVPPEILERSRPFLKDPAGP